MQQQTNDPREEDQRWKAKGQNSDWVIPMENY